MSLWIRVWQAWRRRRPVLDFHEQLARAVSDSVRVGLRAGAIERSLLNEEADVASKQDVGASARR